MIRTSYFAGVEQGEDVVSIARSSPIKMAPAIKVYEPLMPRWALIYALKQRKITEQQYSDRYAVEVLSQLDPATVVSEITALAGPDAILCCWERPDRFCHRHIVAAWLRSTLGLDVREVVA